MGTEGHDSPRDVASKNQKHPWEVFPDDGTSAEISEKKRENEKKKAERSEKRKESLKKSKAWVKSHKILILIIALATVVVIAAGIFAVYKIIEINMKKESQEQREPSTLYDLSENFKLENALTARHAYVYAKYVIKEDVALVGVDPKDPDPIKVEDNMNAYIETLGSDYEKVYYRLYTMYLLSIYHYPERAQFLLSNFEYEHRKLDKNQLYIYYMAYESYYYEIGDRDKAQEYINRINEECKDDEVYYDENGEIIEDMDAYMEKYKEKNEGGNK